jgi:phage shock protein PspC (stress-responsive transcriptional regulator)
MGGLGEWMEVHPGLLRFSYVVLILLTGILPGIALYGIMHFLIPEAPHHMPRSPRIPNSY